ncbi:hypothetical protein BDE02_04G043800 [Populus trichocarpa]|nr:hypothetical protein BDE02_04G043800 [Populus trichocarpa]
MGSEAKKQSQQRRIQVKSKSYLHSGDTKHVIAGMAIITLVFGIPWFLMNRGWFSFLLTLPYIYVGCFNISFGLVVQ